MSYERIVICGKVTVKFNYDMLSGDLSYVVARPDGRSFASSTTVDRNDLENGIRPRQTYLDDLAKRLVRRTRNVRVSA